MSLNSEHNLSIIPGLDDIFKTDPFLRYNLGNGDLIKMVEKTGAAGIFIRTKDLSNDSPDFGSVSLPELESGNNKQFDSPISEDSSEPGEMSDRNCSQSEELQEDAEDQIPAQNDNPEQFSTIIKTKWSAMFIPTPQYDRLVLFKSVNRVTESTANEISSAFIQQLSELYEQFETTERSFDQFENDQKIHVHIVILLHKSNESVVAELENAFKTKMENSAVFPVFNVNFHIIHTDKSISDFQNSSQKQKLELLLKSENQASNPLIGSKFLQNLVTQIGKEKIVLSQKLIKRPGSGVCTLAEQDRMIEFFRIYFGGKDANLVTVPDFDRCMSHLLYSTTEDAVREGNESHVGEVWKYSKQLLAKLEKPAGILLKNFTLNHINSFLDIPSYFNFAFEIDWLFCGSGYFVPFEISVATKAESYETTLTNKLTQVLEKLIPKVKLFLYTILKEVKSDGKTAQPFAEEFKYFVDNYLKIIIYIPNANFEKINEALSNIESKLAKRSKNSKSNVPHKLATALKNAQEIDTMKFVHILIHNNDVDEIPTLYKIGDSLNLTTSETSIEEIFDCLAVRRSEPIKLVEYVLSVFCLSNLMIDNTCHLSRPFDIDSRYRNSQLPKNEKSKLDQINNTLNQINKRADLSLIVSPQQLRILKFDHKLCCLPGEPGCGKTSVLLAKALIESRNNDTDLIIFAMPRSKTAFRKVVQKFFDSNLTAQDERSKVQIMCFDEFSSSSLQEEIAKTCNSDNLKRCVLLLDEIYMGHDNASGQYFLNRNSLCNVLLQCKRCWIAYVSLGNHDVFGSPLSEMIVRHFVIENMNVIFRSAHHISAFSNDFIHTRKPITGSTALVTGCYTSSQLEIKVNSFDKTKLFSDPDQSWFSLSEKYEESQMIIVLAENDEKENWNQFMRSQERDIKNCEIYIVKPETEFYQLPFSGCEAWAVLILIDVDCSSFNTMSAIALATSRAQYEVVLSVNEEHRESLDSFLKMKPNSYLRRLENLSIVKTFTPAELKTVTDDSEMQLLVQGVVNLERLPSLISFMESFSEDHKRKFAIVIFKTFSHRRRVVPVEFLKRFEELMGSHLVDSLTKDLGTESFSDLREIERKCITYGNVEKFDWVLRLIGEEKAKLWAQKSNEWLLIACCNQRRNVIPWVIEKLKTFDLLQDQMSRIYQKEFGYELFETREREIAPVTLLLILCCQNATSDYLECILDSGFPKELLAKKLDGKNAYEWCEFFDNKDNMKLLLGSPERRDIFEHSASIVETIA